MSAKRALLTAITSACLVVPMAADASPEASAAAKRAGDHLVGLQTSSGAFFSTTTPAHLVAETVSALAGAGRHATAVKKALGYMAEHGPGDARIRGAYAGRLVTALVIAGQDPRSFAGFDHRAQLWSWFDPVTGRFDKGDLASNDPGDVYDNALAALGVVLAGDDLPAETMRYLEVEQCSDGGFGSPNGCLDRTDVDTTALVLTALAVDGKSKHPVAVRALGFLRSAQTGDGGFGFYPDSPTTSNSTGLALRALAWMGEDIDEWIQGGRSPIDALLDLQDARGYFNYRRGVAGAKDYATVQALQGLAPFVEDPDLPAPPIARTTTTALGSVPTAKQQAAVAAIAATIEPPPTPLVRSQAAIGRTAPIPSEKPASGGRAAAAAALGLVVMLHLSVRAWGKR